MPVRCPWPRLSHTPACKQVRSLYGFQDTADETFLHFKLPPGPSPLVLLCTAEPCPRCACLHTLGHTWHSCTLFLPAPVVQPALEVHGRGQPALRDVMKPAAHITDMNQILKHRCVMSGFCSLEHTLFWKGSIHWPSVCFREQPTNDFKYLKVVDIQVLNQGHIYII